MIKRLLMAVALLCACSAHAQTVQPLTQPRQHFVDGSGNPCAGCSLYSYAAGTTTPQATFTDATSMIPNPNPVILDTAGSANIWMTGSPYKFALLDTSGTTLWTVDQVVAPLSGLAGFLPLTGGTLSGGLIINGTLTVNGNTSTFGAATIDAAGDIISPNVVATSLNGILNVPVVSLPSAITTCGSQPNCTIMVTGQYVISANLTVPTNVTLWFTTNGQLLINTGITLTVNGAITAPNDTQIFAGSGAINTTGLFVSRPEWFGTGSGAFEDAVDALVSDGILLLRNAAYVSPYIGTHFNLKPVKFIGVGRPVVNTGHTAYQAGTGTIIQGGLLSAADRTEVHHLGVDCGSGTIGSAADCLVIDNASSQVPGITPLANAVADDVSCLGFSSSAAFHCMLFENVQLFKAEHLFSEKNEHGMVFKGTSISIHDVHPSGHAGEGLFIGSNSYAPAGNIHADGIFVNPVIAGDLGTGVTIIGNDAALNAVDISGVYVNGQASDGVAILSGAVSGAGAVTGVKMTNVNVDGGGGSTSTTSVGIRIQGSALIQNVNIANSTVNNLGFGLFMGSDAIGVQFTNITGINFNIDGADLRGNAPGTSIVQSQLNNAASCAFRVVAGVVFYAGLETNSSCLFAASGGTSALMDGSQPTVVSSFSNSWTNYGSGTAPVFYFIDRNIVHIGGRIMSGTAPLVFNLPAGLRPTRGTMTFPAVCQTSSGPTISMGEIDILTTGDVDVNNVACAAGGYVGLDGINFPTY